MRQPIVILVLLVAVQAAAAQQWAITYDGGYNEWALAVQQTSEGGYIVLGYTESFGSGGDAWILKLDKDGNVEWQKAYGGSNRDEVYAVQQTSDGGYIVVGCTESFGSKPLDVNAWILKLDRNGNIEWQNAYGSDRWDSAEAVQQTSDGGYIVVGGTYSFGSGYDIWILKLNRYGNIEWQKAYGGGGGDYAYAFQQTSDGGYIVVGYTESFGSRYEAWLIKLDRDGNIEWQNAYGGRNQDEAYAVLQTSDGGYIIVGYTESFGSGGDAWILKLDKDGNVEWQKAYGGIDWDKAYLVQQTSDGGYIVVGETKSFVSKPLDVNAWVLKFDRDGNIPNCNISKQTHTSVKPTQATVKTTSAEVKATSARITNTNAKAVSTNAKVQQVCYHSAPTQTQTQVLTPMPTPAQTTPIPSGGTPGFEAIFAIAGMLVAYLLRRR